MPKIETTTAFEVVLKDNSTFRVMAGESEVPEEVATHWFVKAHLVDTPKGRNPLVKGDKHLIEADEAGQRVGPRQYLLDPLQPPLRQEGPFSGQQVPEDAPEAATTGTPVTEEARDKMDIGLLPAISPAAVKETPPPPIPKAPPK